MGEKMIKLVKEKKFKEKKLVKEILPNSKPTC